MKQRKKVETTLNRFSNCDENKEEKFVFALWLAKLDITNGAKVFSDEKEAFETGQQMRNSLKELNIGTDQPTIKKISTPRYYWMAAAAILAIIIGVYFYPKEETIVKIALKEISTGINQYKQLTLPDGSTIRLHKESKLSIPETFNDTLREVFLTGEAFFSIARNEKKPFIVHAEHLDIKVLGTSFNVRHAKDRNETEVLVHTGKVAVYEKGNNNKNWQLKKGVRLVYNTTAALSQPTAVRIDTLTQVTQSNKAMVFKNERLDHICKNLENRYGITIHIHTAAIKEARLNLKIKDETLPQVLELLGKAAGFSYTITGNQVDIIRE